MQVLFIIPISSGKSKRRDRNSRQPQIRKLLPQHRHELLPHLMLPIVLIKRIPLLHTRIPADGTNIHHPIPKLHKRAPLNRQVQIRHIMQHKPHKLLVLVLAQPLYEAVTCEGYAEFIGCEPVFAETEVEHGGDGDGGGAELLLLFGEVGAADESDGYFVAEGGEEGEHFGGCGLVGC